ncbi:MAG: hypothetical protein JW763_02860 [candidate division Zixibacteria bacterium]|nr:hypothetical protein [candidate division Zixibacteria bacterium]
MNTLLLAAILLCPMIHHQPEPWDTLNDVNFHIVSGMNMGSEYSDPGPEFGAKLEYVLIHPIAVRLAGNFTFSSAGSHDLPDGERKAFDLSLEALAYRGREDYFIYLGVGLVRTFNTYRPDRFDDFRFNNEVYDSLLDAGSLLGVKLEDGWGYRVVAGGRFKEHYSLELGIQRVWADFDFLLDNPGDPRMPYIDIYRDQIYSTAWLTIGYIFTL